MEEQLAIAHDELSNGNLAKARELFLALLAQAQSSAADDLGARCVAGVGAVCRLENNIPEAERNYARALALARSCMGQRTVCRCLANLADIHHGQRKLDLSEQEYVECIELCEALLHRTSPTLQQEAQPSADAEGSQPAANLADLEALASALAGLAAVWYTGARFRDAIGPAKRAMELYERDLDDIMGVATVCSTLGSIYECLGQYEEALQFQGRYLENAQRAGDRSAEGKAHSNYGLVLAALGRYEDALRAHAFHHAIAVELKDKHEQARAMSNSANALLATHRVAEAKTRLSEALSLASEANEPMLEAQILAALGNAHIVARDFRDAISPLTRALKKSEDLKDSVGMGRIRGLLGTAFQSLGMYDQAVIQLNRALELARTTQDRASEGRILGVKGAVLNSQNRFAEAVGPLRESLAIARAIKDVAGQARMLGLLGSVLLSMSELDQAAPVLVEALALARRLGDVPTEGRIAGLLAQLSLVRNQPELALPHVEQSLAVAQAHGDVSSQAKSNHRLATICWQSRGACMALAEVPDPATGVAPYQARTIELCTLAFDLFQQLEDATQPEHETLRESIRRQKLPAAELLQLALVDTSQFAAAAVYADKARAQNARGIQLSVQQLCRSVCEMRCVLLLYATIDKTNLTQVSDDERRRLEQLRLEAAGGPEAAAAGEAPAPAPAPGALVPTPAPRPPPTEGAAELLLWCLVPTRGYAEASITVARQAVPSVPRVQQLVRSCQPDVAGPELETNRAFLRNVVLPDTVVETFPATDCRRLLICPAAALEGMPITELRLAGGTTLANRFDVIQQVTSIHDKAIEELGLERVLRPDDV